MSEDEVTRLLQTQHKRKQKRETAGGGVGGDDCDEWERETEANQPKQSDCAKKVYSRFDTQGAITTAKLTEVTQTQGNSQRLAHSKQLGAFSKVSLQMAN